MPDLDSVPEQVCISLRFAPTCVVTTHVTPPCRRAKAKLQLRLKARAVEKLEPPPESPPELSSGFDVDICSLIHEDKGNCAALPFDHPACSLMITSCTPAGSPQELAQQGEQGINCTA